LLGLSNDLLLRFELQLVELLLDWLRLAGDLKSAVQASEMLHQDILDRRRHVDCERVIG
jgi:hypothetical protein